ncbi:proteasome-interacting protein cic1 [Balamuthia mandrillaris]
MVLTSGLDRNQVERAVRALFQHLEEAKKKQKKSALLDEVDTLSLIVALKRIPGKPPRKPVPIAIPHTLHRSSEICIFTKDPQEEYKKLFFEDKPCDGVKKVISFTKLRNNYNTYEAKRKLAGSYDLFLTDDRILPLLARKLTKAFFVKKKHPIPVNLKAKNLPQEIAKARDATYLFLNTGPSFSVKIATTEFTVDEAVDNIMEGLENIAAKIPKKWKNVQAVNLKATNTIALPIYNSLPDMALEVKGAVKPQRKAKGKAKPAAGAVEKDDADYNEEEDEDYEDDGAEEDDENENDGEAEEDEEEEQEKEKKSEKKTKQTNGGATPSPKKKPQQNPQQNQPQKAKEMAKKEEAKTNTSTNGTKKQVLPQGLKKQQQSPQKQQPKKTTTASPNNNKNNNISKKITKKKPQKKQQQQPRKTAKK